MSAGNVHISQLNGAKKMRMLLVEECSHSEKLLMEALRGAGYLVDVCGTMPEFLSAARTICYDLIIVDLILRDAEGLDAVRTLRAEHCYVPIIISTAKASVEDRVLALDAGADDYLIKPFDYGELLARVRALLRRPSEMPSAVLRAGNTELDEAQALVRISGKPVYLRPKERRLLGLLMRRYGTVVRRETIEETLSDFGRELSTSALEAQVSRLRKGLAGTEPGIIIKTVRPIGYALIPH